MADVDVSRAIASLTVLLLPLFASAQQRASADVEIKQVSDGKVLTITKSVYCENNGRLVVSFHKPHEYWLVTGSGGESKFYFPATNEVLVENTGAVSSSSELLSLFLFGRLEDLGLTLEGYRLISTQLEDGRYVRRTYGSTDPSKTQKALIVSTADYLPIYCEFSNAEGRILGKTYYAHYEKLGGMPFPTRVTDIQYKSRTDSVVVRTLYSNLRLGGDDPAFRFKVPSDAKLVLGKNPVR